LDRQLKRFREEVGERLRVLHTALEDLRGGSAEAEASVRRIARSIRHAAGLHGLAEIRECAGRLDASRNRQELLVRARHLLERIGAGPAGSGVQETKILVIEDEPGSALLLESGLAGEGRQVLVAETAAMAERLMEEQVFDLVFLDLILPDGDGRDLLQRFRTRPSSAQTPVIVYSSRKASQAAAECLALGAQEYLEKPIRPDLARAAADRALGEGKRPPGRGSEPEHGIDAVRQVGPGQDRAASPSRTGAPPRILLVEDDRVTAQVLIHRLRKESMEVVHLRDGLAAYETAREGQVDLAILDVNLPGMDGFEILQRVRELPHFRETPVIMLTSMGREGDIVRGFDLGADDYVMKPFSPAELVARVHRLLAG
jgi:DNA-binding response OmpR family regulator